MSEETKPIRPGRKRLLEQAANAPVSDLSAQLRSTKAALEQAQQEKLEECGNEIQALLDKYDAVLAGVPRLNPSPQGYTIVCQINLAPKPVPQTEN